MKLTLKYAYWPKVDIMDAEGVRIERLNEGWTGDLPDAEAVPLIRGDKAEIELPDPVAPKTTLSMPGK